ncbi:hypothetical protein LSCM1_05765 [Leishmania martiniquensis]|uniref:REH2 DRSM domain-containing protein n=1 Tax=Leishmania martiniquensis TaxID=1580590 RepID=A0A836HSC8_9TRYP|nr:hypothetical protein LSCM1_05765 [Leishmania martiniquensis]
MISLDAIEIEVMSTGASSLRVRHTPAHTEALSSEEINYAAQQCCCAHPQRQRDVSAADFFTAQLSSTFPEGDHEHNHDGTSTGTSANFVSGSGRREVGASLGAAQQWDYCDVHTVDTFARGRIANFVRRMGHSDRKLFCVRVMTPAEAAVITGSATGPTLFAATCQLPLPAPHGSRVAEGVAEDAKEAESLAAMHAERVCDALGVQLFRLRTAQQKHADTVRREEGRYAPYPDDPVKPLGTPVPPPLRLLRTNAASARSSVPAQWPLSKVPSVPEKVPQTSGARSSPSAESSVGDGSSASVSPAAVGGSVAPHPSAGPATPAGNSASPDPTRIVLRRHDPLDDYVRLVSHYTDEEHAERVRTYASSAYYPWVCQWEGTVVAEVDASAAPKAGAMSSDSTVAAAAIATTVGQTFDPTENGMWAMVNDRDARCSPTPQDALVLPIVYDGPCAEARLTDYYLQHKSTLKQHLTVRSASGSTRGPQRMVEAELQLMGLPITAKGKAQTEQMAIHLAAMHAELLLDALGHPLFPADPHRQARHAEVVAGYGRWAMNPLTGCVTPPNPHEALPLPLKIQIGTDEVWLGPEARRHLGHRWSDSEHIIVAMQQLNAQAVEEVEINPPAELLEEAERILEEWQAHVAKSRFTHLFVLLDMESAFQATTVLPVPRQFGIRGGLGVGKTRKMAVQVCSLHALDTLCALGVPLCVDPEQERQYLQHRAALGMVLQRTLPATDGSLMSASGASVRSVPRLPAYVVEGSHVRLLPRIADTLHAMQLRIPQDYCLFGGAREEVLLEVGNQVRTAVQNYLQTFTETLMRRRNIQQRMRRKSCARTSEPDPEVAAGARDSVTVSGSDQCSQTPPETDADATGAGNTHGSTSHRPTSTAVKDSIAKTQAWASQYAMNFLPHTIISGLGRYATSHNVCFLQVPIPNDARSPPPEMLHKIDASAVSSPPHALMGPVYAIAIGTSLKRKDAERACYLHAASILHSFGVDVLLQYPRGQPRTRHALSFADVAKYLGEGPLVITSPFLSDGTLRAPTAEAAVVEPAEAATPPPLERRPEAASVLPDSPAPPPGSLHTPRPVMHANMKLFLESGRGITLPRRRKRRSSSVF